MRFKIHTDITSAESPTLNINGTGGKRILSAGGYPFGSIKGGTWIFAIYDEVLDAYIISGTSDIVNLPVDEIANDDYVPFFDVSGEKSARLLMSDFMKVIAKAIDYKHEVARYTASNTWTCPAGVRVVDAWIVGGGGAGGSNGVGGGGGYCRIVRNIPVTPGKNYDIVVGAGGSSGGDGGTSSAFGYEAEGGKSGDNGGAGGNFGGAYGNNKYNGRDGGSRGSGSRGLGADWHTTNPYDGIDYAGGGGGAGFVGSSTSQAQYAGGYGGGSFGGKNGAGGGNGGGGSQSNANYCGGGGGSYGGGGGGGYSATTRGGSGIVIIYAPVITEV